MGVPRSSCVRQVSERQPSGAGARAARSRAMCAQQSCGQGTFRRRWPEWPIEYELGERAQQRPLLHGGRGLPPHARRRERIADMTARTELLLSRKHAL